MKARAVIDAWMAPGDAASGARLAGVFLAAPAFAAVLLPMITSGTRAFSHR